MCQAHPKICDTFSIQTAKPRHRFSLEIQAKFRMENSSPKWDVCILSWLTPQFYPWLTCWPCSSGVTWPPFHSSSLIGLNFKLRVVWDASRQQSDPDLQLLRRENVGTLCFAAGPPALSVYEFLHLWNQINSWIYSYCSLFGSTSATTISIQTGTPPLPFPSESWERFPGCQRPQRRGWSILSTGRLLCCQPRGEGGDPFVPCSQGHVTGYLS